MLPSCHEISYTYRTIKSADVLLFSFSEHGIFPHLESFNRNEMGIGVYPDSLYDTYELAQSVSSMSSIYAMEDPNQMIWTNTIDSINVYTVFDFDEKHQAGSNVNDILLSLDDMGDTENNNIHELSAISHNFKFSAIPQNDSLQFEVSGRITDEYQFQLKTELVIIE